MKIWTTLSSGFNPYNPCVANMIKVAKQHIVRFHVDDVIASRVNTNVNDKFKECMNHNYDNHIEFYSNRVKVQDNLGISFDFTEKCEVKVNMYDYFERIINEFPN